MTIPELCNLLEIPTEVKDKVIKHKRSIDFNALKKDLELIKMPNPEFWEESLSRLKESLAPDEDGIRILTCCQHRNEIAVFHRNQIADFR